MSVSDDYQAEAYDGPLNKRLAAISHAIQLFGVYAFYYAVNGHGMPSDFVSVFCMTWTGFGFSVLLHDLTIAYTKSRDVDTWMRLLLFKKPYFDVFMAQAVLLYILVLPAALYGDRRAR